MTSALTESDIDGLQWIIRQSLDANQIDALEQLIALARLGASQGWRPIETAPKYRCTCGGLHFHTAGCFASGQARKFSPLNTTKGEEERKEPEGYLKIRDAQERINREQGRIPPLPSEGECTCWDKAEPGRWYRAADYYCKQHGYKPTPATKGEGKEIGFLAKMLVEIANSHHVYDHAVDGPTFTTEGQYLLDAAAALEQLEQDKKYLIEKANRYANAKNEAQSTIAALRDENERLRNDLEEIEQLNTGQPAAMNMPEVDWFSRQFHRAVGIAVRSRAKNPALARSGE